MAEGQSTPKATDSTAKPKPTPTRIADLPPFPENRVYKEGQEGKPKKK